MNNVIFPENFEPVRVEDMPADQGYGLAISVKIVLPTYCQANCRFCFNKETLKTQEHNWDAFLNRIENTLNLIFQSCPNRRFTLDITGAEPTFVPSNLEQVLVSLSRVLNEPRYIPGGKTYYYRDMVDKVVLTTNGFRLRECMKSEYFNIIDIVNISIHSVNYAERLEIFRTKYIPSNRDLQDITYELRSRDKIVTAVAVLDELGMFEYREDGRVYDKPIPDTDKFEDWITNFANQISKMGFCTGRIRMDYTNTADRAFSRRLLTGSFTGKGNKLQKSSTMDVKEITSLSVNIKIFKGVSDFTDAFRGLEFIVDDDGFVYLDYSKKLHLNGDDMKRFNESVYLNKNYKLS